MTRAQVLGLGAWMSRAAPLRGAVGCDERCEVVYGRRDARRGESRGGQESRKGSGPPLPADSALKWDVVGIRVRKQGWRPTRPTREHAVRPE